MDGWIKAYRKLSDSEIWNCERYSKGQAFFDLVLMANHKDNTIYLRGVEIEVKRGQLARSIVGLAKKWKWNERSVSNFLKMLNRKQMIQSKTNNVCTVITILNYSTYNQSTEQSTEQNTEQTQSKVQTNKNVKNVKKTHSSKDGRYPCTDEELQTIAEDLQVSLDGVKSVHEDILGDIEAKDFKHKTVYYTLRKWVKYRIEKGTLKKVTSSAKPIFTGLEGFR